MEDYRSYVDNLIKQLRKENLKRNSGLSDTDTVLLPTEASSL